MFVQTPSAAQPSLANAENKFIISSKATKQTLGFNSESIERPKTKSCVKIWEWSQWKPGKKLAQDQGCTNCLIISTASFVRILEQFRKNSHNFFYGRSRTLLKQNINLASSQLKFYWYFKKICDYNIILHRQCADGYRWITNAKIQRWTLSLSLTLHKSPWRLNGLLEIR